MPLISKKRRTVAIFSGKRFKRVKNGNSWVRDTTSTVSVPNSIFRSRGTRRVRGRFARKVMNVVNRYGENKEYFKEQASNVALRHNNLQNIVGNAFYCAFGTRGEASGNNGNRVGSKIFVRGIKCSIMIENLQKRPLCTYHLYLVRRKDFPGSLLSTKNEMYEGLSTTIPMDYVDTERVQILYHKKFTVRMPNQGTSTSMTAAGFAPLAETSITDVNEYKGVVTNPQTIQKFYVPINKSVSYADAEGDGGTSGTPVAAWQYQWVMTSYDNFSSPSDPANADSHIGSLHFSTVLKFTDV